MEVHTINLDRNNAEHVFTIIVEDGEYKVTLIKYVCDDKYWWHTDPLGISNIRYDQVRFPSSLLEELFWLFDGMTEDNVTYTNF